MIFIGNNGFAVAWNAACSLLCLGTALIGGTKSKWPWWGALIFAGLAILCEFGRQRRLKGEASVQGEIKRQLDDLTCPGCRHVNQPGWSYCSSCGSKHPV